MDAGLLALDDAGAVVLANDSACRLLGRDTASPLGLPLAEVVEELLRYKVVQPRG